MVRHKESSLLGWDGYCSEDQPTAFWLSAGPLKTAGLNNSERRSVRFHRHLLATQSRKIRDPYLTRNPRPNHAEFVTTLDNAHPYASLKSQRLPKTPRPGLLGSVEPLRITSAHRGDRNAAMDFHSARGLSLHPKTPPHAHRRGRLRQCAL